MVSVSLVQSREEQRILTAQKLHHVDAKAFRLEKLLTIKTVVNEFPFHQLIDQSKLNIEEFSVKFLHIDLQPSSSS